MTKIRSLILCFVFLVVTITPSYAAIFSGAYLLELCKRDAQGSEIVEGGHTACQAYIAGIIDYHKLLRSLGTSPSVDFCVPDDVKMNDIQDVVWTYLNQNSENDGFIAAPAVALALFEVFPCGE
ncbi:MAG: Rap1a/Tai family immunity protein [Pseudomonadota bacterium]